MTPIFTIALGVIFTGDVVDLRMALGAALAMVGVLVIAFLRPEAKFASLEEMTAQIDDDASMARMILSAG